MQLAGSRSKRSFMRKIAEVFALMLVSAGVFMLAAQAQDEPSLGDVARQARQQKQKDAQPAKDSAAPPKAASDNKGPVVAQAAPDAPKDAAAQPKPPKRVITNDEIPEHVGPTSTLPNNPHSSSPNYPE